MMRTMADEYWYRVRQLALAQARAQSEHRAIPLYEREADLARELQEAA